MNRIYQVIWSSVKNCYVVVSENASRHGKKKAAHLAPSTTKRTMLAMSLGVTEAGRPQRKPIVVMCY